MTKEVSALVRAYSRMKRQSPMLVAPRALTDVANTCSVKSNQPTRSKTIDLKTTFPNIQQVLKNIKLLHQHIVDWRGVLQTIQSSSSQQGGIPAEDLQAITDQILACRNKLLGMCKSNDFIGTLNEQGLFDCLQMLSQQVTDENWSQAEQTLSAFIELLSSQIAQQKAHLLKVYNRFERLLTNRAGVDYLLLHQKNRVTRTVNGKTVCIHYVSPVALFDYIRDLMDAGLLNAGQQQQVMQALLDAIPAKNVSKNNVCSTARKSLQVYCDKQMVGQEGPKQPLNEKLKSSVYPPAYAMLRRISVTASSIPAGMPQKPNVEVSSQMPCARAC